MCVPNETSKNGVSKYQLRQFKNLKYLEKFSASNDQEFKDVISISTQYTKAFLDLAVESFKKLENSKLYIVLFKTTQPAHVLMILAVLTLTSLWNVHTDETIKTNKSRIVNAIYLGSFCAFIGSQFWMTFVSGLSLYFNLPRHQFGEVQRVLFPIYFTLNSSLNFVILFIFTNSIQHIRGDNLHQMISLSVSFIINLSIRLYLAPPLLKLITAKNAIEKTVGLGMEVGMANLGPLKSCPHYLKIHQQFRRCHMKIAIGNLTSMACTVFHLYYLSNAICAL